MDKPEKGQLHLIVGILFFCFIVFYVVDSFSEPSQVEENARLAIKECGKGNIKSVSSSAFTCKD
jgi:Ca2+/Na+ antiporter